MQETSSEGHCRVACEVRGQAAAAQRAKAGQAQQRAQDDAPRVGAGFQSPGRSVVPDRRLSGRRPLTASASAAGHVLQQRAGHAAGRVRGLVLRARQRAGQPHRWPHAGRRQLGIRCGGAGRPPGVRSLHTGPAHGVVVALAVSCGVVDVGGGPLDGVVVTAGLAGSWMRKRAVVTAPVCSWLQVPDNRPTGGREAAAAAAARSETPIALVANVQWP